MQLTRQQRTRMVGALTFAKRLLVAAILVQLVIFVPTSIVPHQKSFEFAFFAGAGLGIVGFLMAYRVIGRSEEFRDSRVLAFVGWRVRASGLLVFIFSFFVPVLNVVIFAWAGIRAHGAIKALHNDQNFHNELEARRARLRGG